MIRPRRSTRHSILPVLLAVAAFLAVPGRALAVEHTFAFTGRGWGHGIGMSQYGAKGYAQAGWKYDAILKHYYTGTTIGTASSKTVRVALDSAAAARSSWALRGNDGQLWVDWDGRGTADYYKLAADQTFTFFRSGNGVVVKNSSGTALRTFPGAVRVWERLSTGAPGTVQVLSGSGPWGWANVAYKGSIRIVSAGTAGVYGYNWVTMEDYVRGVAPRETPASWPTESLKAQAVAARSYAHISLKPSSAFDVYCTTRSQVYNGYGTVSGGVVTRHASDYLYDGPVSATSGKVVKYGAAIASTFFFSTSGGHTENIEYVWDSSPVPYLKGVPDPYEVNAGSTRHIWSDAPHISGAVLKGKLLGAGIDPPAGVSDAAWSIRDVLITSRGVSGRVRTIVLKGAPGQADLTLSGEAAVRKFKNAFGWGDTWFYASSFRWLDGSGNAIDKIQVPAGTAATLRFKVTPVPSNRYVYGVYVNGTLQPSSRFTVDAAGNGTFVTPPITKSTTYRIGSASSAKGTAGYYQGLMLTIALAPGKTVRVAGMDRYDTAVQASKTMFPSGGAGAVVLANGAAPADALTGAGLAGSVTSGAPVLLTRRDALPASTKAELVRLKPNTVYVLGGSGVVADAVLSQIRALPQYAGDATAVRRIGGVDRFDTARLVGLEAKTAQGTGWSANRRVLVVSGESFPDALAASGFAYAKKLPVILVRRTGLPSAAASEAAALQPTKALAVGGPGSVPDSVLTALAGSASSLGGAGAVTRIASGPDRYAVAVNLANYLTSPTSGESFGWTKVVVASGESLVDALAAGPLAGKLRVPLLYVKQRGVPAATTTVLAAHKASITTAYLMGGTATIADAARIGVEDALR